MRSTFLLCVVLAAAWGQGVALSQRINKDSLMDGIRTVRNPGPGKDKSVYEQTLISMIRKYRLAFPIPPETQVEMTTADASKAIIDAALECQLTAADLFPSAAAPSAAIAKQDLLQALSVIDGQKTRPERAMLDRQVAEFLRARRLDFSVTSETEREMIRAGASQAVLTAARERQLSPDEILKSAESHFQSGRFFEASQEAERASALQPSARAFQILADSKERIGDLAGSQAATLKTLSLGGEVAIPVLLAAPGENFRKTCDARLVVSSRRASLSLDRQSPASAECRSAETAAAPILEFGPNEFVGKDRQAFHILLDSPQGHPLNLCLAPQKGNNQWALEVLAAAARQ